MSGKDYHPIQECTRKGKGPWLIKRIRECTIFQCRRSERAMEGGREGEHRRTI